MGQQDSVRNGQPVIWLGQANALLDQARAALDVIHVYDVRVLLHTLTCGVGVCVVVDVSLDAPETARLVQDVRARFPHVGLLAFDTQEAPGKTLFDRILRRDTTVDDLTEAVREITALAEERTSGAAGDADDRLLALQDRLRHLEGLVQATFTISGVSDVSDILGDLNEVARVVVDADSMVVLLADADYGTLEDTFGLGVPDDYLAVCREIFLSFPPDQRDTFLGDEVLLRERLPEMLPSASRVREAAAADVWSYMRLPLAIDQQLVGFVALFSSVPGQFDGAHLQLGRLFANQVATAVRNMRLFLRLNRAEQRQQAISVVARLIADDLALDKVLEKIVDQAVQLVEGSVGIVLLVQPDDSLHVKAVHEPGKVNLMGTIIPPGVGQAGRIARTAQPYIVEDYVNWDGANPELVGSFPPEGVLVGVPLIYRARVLGVLQVIIRDRAIAQETESVLMMLAPQAATAIAKAQLHETVQQERRQLRAILDHTPAAVTVCDTQGRVQLLNPETERVITRLGLSVDDVRDHLVSDLLPQKALAEADLNSVMEIYLGAAGEYLLHVAPITNPQTGEIEQYVGVAQDVTELRSMDRMKGNLMRVLTHDLGGMLMLIRSPIELMQESGLTDTQRENLQNTLTSNLDRMTQLIRNVRDLEMTDTLDRDSMELYNLGDVLEEVRRRNVPRAEKQKVEFIAAPLELPREPLTGHSFLLVQAADNLVSNAIKYTPEGGSVTLSCKIENDAVLIRVEDTGYGIPADKIPFIFDPFYRVKRTDIKPIQGTGLGLSLVRAIADLHGAHITVTSEINKGSLFTLRLPVEISTEMPSGARPVTHLDLSDLVRASAVTGDKQAEQPGGSTET